MGTSPSEMMEDINLNSTGNGGNSSSDDEVVVGEDEELSGMNQQALEFSASISLYQVYIPNNHLYVTRDHHI